ncbi:putative Zn-dependent peptidase [Novosphingobium chloroacetimidivorans]|uniref:Putative Zn-dependent peptidase n=1 Tax=Novosphingobium chloroacetimidivorans TaxID=1428314 RepID=A0A7W7KCE8_9SPHN|nr:pitrilysin family protein [Novosphingobium chloroacetimidivorans]MBB4860262.1 putative Zn-dependent peptidase [Novosphingobium chloroacetimidivorans]
MRHLTTAALPALAAALALSACAQTTASSPASTPPPAAQAALPKDLVAAVDIPFEKFTLANGLTVIVHTDRKAPVVGVTTYYRVGSKHEPRGKTGFAHLYEHLFFGGSANVPSFDIPLEAAGSTPTNGSTWYDRTNYVETVPTGALPLALFMEADRMGHLLPAVTQDKLDKQRGVVQNEKRQGDNEPYGLMSYAVGEGLFPVGHPYRHETIGSMADLDAATLGDVRKWFTDHYGPNNVVLALSGDIDAATARPMVEKYFGAIPRGPEVRPVQAAPVTLTAPSSREMTDRVPVTRITRNWSGPGLNDADAPALEIGLHVLGGLASSRLDNALVRGKEVAVSVTASAQTFEQVSFLQATMDVKPGVDRKQAEAAFDQVIADYVQQGPNEDEVRRAVMSVISGEIGGLEVVGGMGGKGATLAEGELYSNDPAKYKQDLARMAALTPADVRTALQRWLSRPVVSVAVVPGERTESGETKGGWGDEDSTRPPPADPKAPAAKLPPAPKLSEPPVAPIADLDFPTVEHATLSNGIPVALARRTAIPKVALSIAFDAGFAADSLDTPGTQALMLAALEEGTTTRDATAIAEEQERLGASISSGGSQDRSNVGLSALTANLAPSLALLADVVLHPAFRPADVARVRNQQLTALQQVQASPQALAQRTLDGLVYGAHPYALPSDGLGTPAAVAALTPEALRAAHAKWLRPDLARITVVGDITMAQLKPMLEATFSGWKAPAAPAPRKALDAPLPVQQARIVVLDRPASPQSFIAAGRALPIKGTTQGTEALNLANDVLGGGFLSRLNGDLREDKGWSYGVYSAVSRPVGPRTLLVSAPVQTDKTGASVKAILADMAAFPAKAPPTPVELQRVTEGAIRGMPNSFQTNGSVLQAIENNERLGRPDDYYETLASTYRTIGSPAIEAAARQYLQPDGMTIVIVGDRKAVEPQLKGLPMPIEYHAAPALAGESAAATETKDTSQ